MEQHEAAAATHQTPPFYVDYAISACWLMRKDLLPEVGMLDEKIHYSPEDADYCLRAWKSGYKIVYVPQARVTHHTQEISRGLKLNRAKWSHIQGLAYYFQKHNYCFSPPRIEGRAAREEHLNAWSNPYQATLQTLPDVRL